MSWRDLRQIPDDWYEMERPHVSESGTAGTVTEITLAFTDDLSRDWFAEWLKSRRGWSAFMRWVDEKR